MFANGTPLTDTRSPSDARRILHKFATDQLSTRDVLGEINDQLAGFGLSSNDLGVLELILAEALNNIFEHAYEAGTGPVELDLIVTERAVICELRDLGRPMPGGTPPHDRAPLPHGRNGRARGGLRLVHHPQPRERTEIRAWRRAELPTDDRALGRSRLSAQFRSSCSG